MTEAPSKPVVRTLVFMPGGVMARLDLPPGVPDFDTTRSRQIALLQKSPAFNGLAVDERAGLISSLAGTVRRAAYHHKRFGEILRELGPRRDVAPGEIFYDAAVDCLHYEFQASCGAARMSLDELVYIIARRHGATGAEAKRRGTWETDNVITSNKAAAEYTLPEVAELRSRQEWYKTLKSYRNSFFHHGWRHGTGHFAKESKVQAAKVASRNALILPDRASLSGRSKPHEWTWNDSTMIDDVAGSIHDGLEGLLKCLCENHWATAEPTKGTVPPERHPTMVVTLVKPLIVQLDTALVVPLFSTKELAEKFAQVTATEELEIYHMFAASSFLNDEPSLVFSLHGLQSLSLPPSIESIHVLMDPQISDGTWAGAKATHKSSISLQELFRQGIHRPVQVSFPGVREVFCWHQQQTHEWPAF
jgi:hypothetical protein